MAQLREPSWWYERRMTLSARVLQPVAWGYGRIAELRWRRVAPYRSRLPVICIGNLTAGGTGKTPIAMLVARVLSERGLKPAFLSRGYGGRARGPQWVDAEKSSADEVGDEPLLLARVAPVVVARDRVAGARAIEATDADVIVMDDGMQNPALTKDLVLAVVDASRGFGNGAVIPAGPLRAPLAFQLGLADAMIVSGAGVIAGGFENAPVLAALKREFHGAVLAADVRPRASGAELKGRRVVAYAGIANPVRFFETLTAVGAEVVVRETFPDHHRFSAAEADRLLVLAETSNAALVTTEKDVVRLGGDGAAGRLKAASTVLAIDAVTNDADRDRLEALISAAMEKRRGLAG